MDTADITMTLGIFIVFSVMATFNVMVQGIKKVQNNWPEYRCHPGVIPFTSQFKPDISPEENFTFCIAHMQSNSMGNVLGPIQNTIGNITRGLGTVGDSVNSQRGFMDYFRTQFGFITHGITGLIANVLIIVQDLMQMFLAVAGGLIGIVSTLNYMVVGTEKTMTDVWNGPPGKIAKAIGKM